MKIKSRSIESAISYPCIVMTEIIRAIVEHPDQVTVEILTPDNDEIVLLVELAPEDINEIVGQGGRIIQALRTFLHAVAAKNDARIKLQIKPMQV